MVLHLKEQETIQTARAEWQLGLQVAGHFNGQPPKHYSHRARNSSSALLFMKCCVCCATDLKHGQTRDTAVTEAPRLWWKMKKRVIHISKDREARLPITVEEKSLRQTHNVTLNVCLLHLRSPKAGSGLSSAQYADDNLNGTKWETHLKALTQFALDSAKIIQAL